MADQQPQPPKVNPDASPPGPGPSRVVRGAEAVAREAPLLARLVGSSHRVLVNGEPGLLSTSDGHPQAVLSLTVRNGRIVEINVLADPARLHVPPDDLAGEGGAADGT